MPKLSIIIPIYNAEKYLARCIDSVLAQPLKEIELLLVNDGSPDRSLAICEEYAKKDSRVKVLNKANGGVSSARNMGLDHAQGEYVTFIDADDWLDEGTITEELLNGGFDVIKLPRDRGSRLRSYDETLSFSNSKESKRFAAEHYNCECWGKIYKRSLIGDLRFRLGIRIGEDLIFVARIYDKLTSLQVLGGTMGYHYMLNDEGAFRTLSEETDFLLLKDELLKMIQETNNPIAWDFLVNHLYIIEKLDDLYKFAYDFSLIKIAFAPITFQRKKELARYKFHYWRTHIFA